MWAATRPEVRDWMVGFSGREAGVMREDVVGGKAEIEYRYLSCGLLRSRTSGE